MKLPHVFLLVLIEVLLTATACSNRKTAVPGKPCELNSDCDSPLACTLEKCHEACRANGDCSGGERCVLGGATDSDAQSTGTNISSLRVCLLIDEEHCAFNSVCPSPLVCGRDLKCRNQCMEKVDCAKDTDECVVGGPNGEKVCAEPPAVGGNGELISAPDAGMGAPDAGVDGGPDTATDAGAPGTDAGAPGTDAPIVTGVEAEPNDDQTTATTYVAGTTVTASIGSATDVDTYKIVAPADRAGGFFQGSFTNMGLGAIQFSVVSPINNAAIASQPAGGAAGAVRYFYWAAAPGQTYYLIVNPNAATVFDYTVKVDYTTVVDEHEPNDAKAQATAITPGTPVMASFFTGYTMSTIDAMEYADWYVVDLQAGPATAAVHMVPDDVRLQVRVVNATTDVVIGQKTNLNAGADIDASFTIATPGRHYVVVEQYGGAVPAASSITVNKVPFSFTEQYQLNVTQP